MAEKLIPGCGIFGRTLSEKDTTTVGSVMITTISVIRRGKYTLHQLIGLFIKITHPLLYFFLRLFRIYSEKRILLRTLASEDK